MDKVKWQKFVGQFNDSLAPFGKEHITADSKTTLCGKEIPTQQDANVEFLGEYNDYSYIECKSCAKANTGEEHA